MKRQWKGFFPGVLTALILVGLIGTAYATVGRRTVELDYNDINVRVNGKDVVPTDANGNAVEPFAINGTIYLPIRAVGNAMGYESSWDASTKTAYLLDDSFARNYELWAEIYMNNAVALKQFGDNVRWAQTICQEMLFTEAAKDILPASDIKNMCNVHDKNIQILRDKISNYENSLPGLCSSSETAKKMANLYKDMVSQLQKANDSIAGKGGTFTTHYSAALKNSNDLIALCDEAFNARIADAKNSMNKIEISIDEAVVKQKESGHGIIDTKSNGGSSTGGGSNTSDRNLQLYLSDKAALDAAYQAERPGLAAAVNSAQQTLNQAFIGKPGPDMDIAINMAQRNLDAAEKALQNCDNAYNSNLSALSNKYGI